MKMREKYMFTLLVCNCLAN